MLSHADSIIKHARDNMTLQDLLHLRYVHQCIHWDQFSDNLSTDSTVADKNRVQLREYYVFIDYYIVILTTKHQEIK